jgi:hypothetical protein
MILPIEIEFTEKTTDSVRYAVVGVLVMKVFQDSQGILRRKLALVVFGTRKWADGALFEMLFQFDDPHPGQASGSFIRARDHRIDQAHNTIG